MRTTLTIMGAMSWTRLLILFVTVIIPGGLPLLALAAGARAVWRRYQARRGRSLADGSSLALPGPPASAAR